MSLENSAAERRGERAHRLSFLANLGLAALKGGVGWLVGAPILIADGFHSLSDVALSSAAWVGYRWSKHAPDEDHHYGHGNGEALAALLVGGILVAAGAGLAWAGLPATSGLEADLSGSLALASVGVVMAIKAALARRVGAVAAELNSPSLTAVARDHASDVWAGLVTLAGVGAGVLGASMLEQIAAAVIGLFVARMGWLSLREGFDVLMDRVDPSLRELYAKRAAAVEGVLQVGPVRVHPLGAGFRVDLEIDVDGGLTVAEGHQIAHAVEDALVEGESHVDGVHVHVNPWKRPPG